MTMNKNLWLLAAALFLAIAIIQLILIANATIICRPVANKTVCYDDGSDTTTVCRVVNGNLVCD